MTLPRSNNRTIEIIVPLLLAAVAVFKFLSLDSRASYYDYILQSSTLRRPSSNASTAAKAEDKPAVGFQCPVGLLPVSPDEPWEWNFTSSRRTVSNHGNLTMSTPTIISFRLEEEKHAAYYNRTKGSLAKHNYSSAICEVASVDGAAWERAGNLSAIVNLNLTYLGPGKIGAQGCFLSHLSAWILGLKHNIPVISLESDTVAIRAWDISPDVYKDYDILFLHDHRSIGRKCTASQMNSVREGLPFWWATGAMMYTNNNPEKFERVLKEELIDGTVAKPVDHWMNKLWNEKKLRIGSLCPNFFRQMDGHVSTVDPRRGEGENPMAAL